MSAHSSKKAPVYAQLVADGEALGTSGNPLVVREEGGTPSDPSEFVSVVGSETLYAGTVSVGTTASALAASQDITKVVVQNDPISTNDLLVGNATVQPIKLVPGASIEIEVNDLSKVYVKAATGTVTANYLAGS